MNPLKPTRRLPAYMLLSLIALLLLSGCLATGQHFSPEAAAQQAVMNNPNPDMRTDPGSVRTLQQYQIDGRTLVMVSFRGNDQNIGEMQCQFVYEVNRMFLGGWNTGSGGGSCRSETDNPEEQPLTIGASISSGGRPMDPGLSSVYGLVLSQEIRSVQVTWKDSMMQQVEPINGSYLAARSGQYVMEKVEGLNADGEIIYSSAIEMDPEKQKIEEEINNAKP